MSTWLLTSQKSVLNDNTMTNISKSFIHKMAAKTGWHRNETELRHCHPMHNQIKKSLLLSLQVKFF